MTKKRIVISLLLVVMLSMIAVANKMGLLAKHEIKQVLPVAKESLPTPVIMYDTVLLKKLDVVLKTFTMEHYTLSGYFDMINKADTSEKVTNTGFLICKDGNNFYYKMGKTIALQESGLYITVNPDTRKIFTKENQQTGVFKIIDIEQLKQALKTEQYQVLSKNSNEFQTISLVNEHNMSCKEYAITFDTLSKRPINIHYRLTYLPDPLNKNKEKVVNIKITQCDNKTNLDLHHMKSEIIEPSGKLTGKYSGFELVHL
jgi:hypothetical protein